MRLRPVFPLLLTALTACAGLSPCPAAPNPAGDSTPEIVLRRAQVSRPVAKASIPRAAEGSDFWKTNPPLFEVRDAPGEFTARGWGAWAGDQLLLRVVVTDSAHSNEQTGANIWNGDSIQVGMDMMPLDALLESATGSYANPFIGAIAFALTKNGPRAWAHHLGKIYGGGAGNPDGSVDRWRPRIERDDAAQTTTYMLRFPAREFNCPPDLPTHVGLTVLVNNGAAPNQARLQWGDGLGAALAPGLNMIVPVEPSPSPELFWTAASQRVWKPGDEILLLVSVPAMERVRLDVMAGSPPRTFEPPAGGPHRILYEIALRYPSLAAIPEKIGLAAARAGAAPGRAESIEFPVEIPSRNLDALAQRIGEIKKSAGSAETRASLDAIMTAAKREWAGPAREERQDLLDATATLAGLVTPAMADEANYKNRLFQRMAAFPSSVPGALNFYKIRLPNGFQKERAYPVMYELHAAGVRGLVQFIGLDLSPRQLEMAGTVPEFAAGEYFEVKLFVGKRRYLEDGASMVWEQVSHFERSHYKVDPDRRYLRGASKGGFGAWSLGLRTPDRWAAIAIDCGGLRDDEEACGLARNAGSLPVMITHGDADTLVPATFAKRMREQLRKWGNEPEFRILPGVGHTIPAEAGRGRDRWLLQHTRRAPREFQFVALPGDARHHAAWGIRLHPRENTKPAEMGCRIEEPGRVILRTVNVRALNVAFGGEGLPVASDNVAIQWNGKPAYSGPKKALTLTE